MILGTLATAAAAWLTMKMPKWYLAALPPVFVNALILAPMWAWAETGAVNGAFWAACGFKAVTFIPCEALVCYALGTPLLKLLPKVSVLKPALVGTSSTQPLPPAGKASSFRCASSPHKDERASLWGPRQ